MFTGKYPPRRLFRLNWNRKHKQTDRHKGTLAKMLPDGVPPKYKRFRRWARDSYRQRTAPATGYGVAFE